MKKLIAFFFFFSCSLIAQDTIRFTNGEMKAVKVNEVGLSEVKFSRFESQDSLSYVVDKSDVFLIKYSNGQSDTFKLAEQKTLIELSEPVMNSISAKKPIEFKRGSVYMDAKSLRSKEFIDLINNHPDVTRRSKLLELLGESDAHRTKQYQYGFVGSILAIGTFFICTASGEAGMIAVGAIAGTGIMVSSQVISNTNKDKRLKKLKEAVDLYNK